MSEEKKEGAAEEKEEKKRDPLHIPLRFIRNEGEDVAEEMQEMFDEDKVVHRQGSSEPEAD